MHTVLRFTEYTFSTAIFPMDMQCDAWSYNWLPDIQYGISTIEIWSRSIFEIVSETMSNFNVWGCTSYLLEP